MQQLSTYFAKPISFLGLNHSVSMVIVLAGILLTMAVVSAVTYFIAKKGLVRLIAKLAEKMNSSWLQALHQQNVFYHLAQLAPATVVYLMAPVIATLDLPFMSSLSHLLDIGSIVFILCVSALSISALFDAFGVQYQHFKVAKYRPVKSYIQVGKIMLYLLLSVLVIATVLGKSPTYLFTGLGAMTAVIMLVFKDSILGFVTSIQLSTNDMVRIGDWIEMPKFGVDGAVIDMSLNTIKVQNFDKTVVTVPSYALLSNGVKNWRGMSESGGRRIKRAVHIDVNTIKFAENNLLDHLRQIGILRPALDAKLNEISQFNQEQQVDTTCAANGRRLTNLGLFREYLELYLKQHPRIHENLTFLVRQLENTGKGIPIELYIFTNTTDWVDYEGIQADIFDHIYAVLPQFELQAFQQLSGTTLRLANALDAAKITVQAQSNVA